MSILKTAGWLKPCSPHRENTLAESPGSRRSSERGSITLLTLLAFAVLTGAFLYVAVIGSRIAETTRARVAADATAMAAATIKARVMNYESFLLTGQSILLPLAETTAHIRKAQVVVEAICVVAAIVWWELIPYCVDYGVHMSQTKPRGPDKTVNEWLQGLQDTAKQLDGIGPQWAAIVASRTGLHDSYRGTDGHGVTQAAAYPRPGPFAQCRTLGIKMVNNNEEVNDDGDQKSACSAYKWLQLVYIATSARPKGIILDTIGLGLTGHLLPTGVRCTNSVRVPRLGTNWKDYSVSYGMALITNPSDRWFQGYLEALRGTKPPRVLGAGVLLGKSCAEHYSQDHYSAAGDTESLFHMDWRARMVPCNFDAAKALNIVKCSVPGADVVVTGLAADIPIQFAKEMAVGMQQTWKY